MNIHEDIDDNFIPGSLITISGIRLTKLYIIVKRWKINSSTYIYRLLSQEGNVYEAYYDCEYWNKIE
jgi:hypothetical protein